jgi:hypothetical protein
VSGDEQLPARDPMHELRQLRAEQPRDQRTAPIVVADLELLERTLAGLKNL